MHNADYQWLLASLTSLDSARKEKTLSLNLKKRQQQRTAQDLARLTQEMRAGAPMACRPGSRSTISASATSRM
jgi:hypothetical protein